MKRYIRSATTLRVPEACQKYYKVCKDDDPQEVQELKELFSEYGLTYLGHVCAKSRYKDLLDKAEILEASLCKGRNGEIGVYVFSGDKAKDITYDVEDIIVRAREEQL